MITDSHVHVISNDLTRYPFSPDERGLGEWVQSHPVTVGQLLEEMGGASVDRALLVQASSAYGHENAYAADSAQTHRDRCVGICIIDMLAANAADTLSLWVDIRGMRGIRLFTTPHPDAPWLDDPATLPVWERTRDLGVPMMVQVLTQHVSRLGPMIERFPEIPVALDHLANAQLVEGNALPPEVLALADYPNVYGKISTSNLYAVHERGVPAADYFGPAIERFGAGRLMWGSNYPNVHDRSYADMVALARAAFGFLPAADQDLLFGGTALKLWPELKE